MSTTFGAGTTRLVRPGEPAAPGDWMVSDWDAGQSSILRWSPDNVRLAADGAVEFVLSAASAGSPRPYLGGEAQSVASASTGTWTWLAQAPRMVDGAVFGMFTYRADHFADPWIEFDFEFVGANTTQVRLNIHMETPTGEHVTLEEAKGGPVIVDLGFDAAQGVHSYQVTVTGTEAIFLVDGQEVARFDGSDMPGGVWTTGEMKGFVNLWAVDPTLSGWAGDWTDPGSPLVARVEGMGHEPSDPLDPLILGTDGSDALVGTDGDDEMDGGAGDDSLDGGAGNDTVRGGEGNDSLRLDAGDDRLEGGLGDDWVRAAGSLGVTIDLVAGAQATGQGSDTLLGIENASGAGGADRLSGGAGANALEGRGGDDVLQGRAGADRLSGGAGRDVMHGGTDTDGDVFVFGAVGDSAVGQRRDVVHDFRSGIDGIDLSAIDARPDLAADQAFRFAGGAAAWSAWAVAAKGDLILRADVTGDRTADFELRLAGVASLAAADLVL